MPETLLVLVGPTGVGKTALSIRLAQHLGCSILSADSRQIFRELPIGTAAPSLEERAAVPHYFVGERSVEEPYSAAMFEAEAMALLPRLFSEGERPIALVSGGSMMYVDALCHGIDEMPDVRDEVRQAVWRRYEEGGLEGILGELKILDPDYYHSVDPKNYKRVLHGYEVSLSTGRPFSSFHSGRKKERPFRIIKLGLTREREELYERIDRRVYMMLEAGLVEEARKVYPQRHLNALLFAIIRVATGINNSFYRHRFIIALVVGIDCIATSSYGLLYSCILSHLSSRPYHPMQRSSLQLLHSSSLV